MKKIYEKLRDELYHIQINESKLENFINCSEYKKLDIDDQTLLQLQLHAMKAYDKILLYRMCRIHEKINEGEEIIKVPLNNKNSSRRKKSYTVKFKTTKDLIESDKCFAFSVEDAIDTIRNDHWNISYFISIQENDD